MDTWISLIDPKESTTNNIWYKWLSFWLYDDFESSILKWEGIAYNLVLFEILVLLSRWKKDKV